jgi:hypothetical protein
MRNAGRELDVAHRRLVLSAEDFESGLELWLDLGEPPQTLDAASPRPVVWHEFMAQLTLVQAGSGVVLLDESEYEVSDRTLLYIPPGCRHAFATSTELRLLHWHWPQRLLASDRHTESERHQFKLLAT